MIDPLESRKLLSATLDADGTLTVTGTDADDVISIAPNAANDHIDVADGSVGSELSFELSKVEAIFVVAGAGNDVVKISNGISIAATILGGDGQDTLTGGAGRDSIQGEAGVDRLDGGKRNDRLVGDDGDDIFVVPSNADGNDQFDGGAGNDTIDYSRRKTPITVRGGALDIVTPSTGEHDAATDIVETLIGTAGNDDVSVDRELNSGDGILTALYGYKGDDILTLTPLGHAVSIYGGDGNDRLSDAAFTDLPNEVHFFGEAGHDVFRASAYPTIRLIRGGDGTDTADFSFAVGGATVSLDNVANDFVPSRFLDQDLIGNVFDDVENLIGAANGTNTLVGSDDDNVFTLHGLAPSSVRALGGNDIIVGNRSLDSTEGDTIDGGAGIDMCEDDPSDTISGIESTFAFPGAVATKGAPVTRAKPPAAGSALSRGKLSVFGSSGDDFIRITQTSAGVSVSISGLETKVYSPASSVKTISVNAGAGNDEVVLFKKNGTGRVTRPAAIYGGDGDDRLFAGDGSVRDGDIRGGNHLVGGRGDDSLVGGNGRDYLDGGDQLAARDSNSDLADGADTLVGGAGDDFVSLQSRNADTTIRFKGSKPGNAAEDVINGVENVLAGRGNDTIIGDVATNIISGGLGNDTITGGGGLDQILANFGNDRINVDDDTSFDFVKLSDDLLQDTCFANDEDFVSIDSEDVLNPA